MDQEARKQSFSREEILQIGRGEYFGEEAPRLPLPNMLMFDRITHVADQGGAYNRGVVVAEMDVDPSQWFFQCHFRGDPVMPGCLGVDALWQLTGFFLGWNGHLGRGRAIGAKEIKFFGQILPTHKLVRYTVDIRRVIARKVAMAIADGRVEVDGEQIYTVRDMRVGIFTEGTMLV